MSWWEWVFSGVGVAVLAVGGNALREWLRGKSQSSGASLNAQGAKVEKSPVISGSNNTQIIDSFNATKTSEDSWPDVILECQWPSLVHEARLRTPGSHIVRKRPWMLRYRGTGAVYNVNIHRIRFGAYLAMFPYPVSTLTDTASVFPLICHNTERPDLSVVTTHDLESLIQNPPEDADVRQYAVRPEGLEGEGIESFVLEVEIPVTISYEDKNGNQFRIRYALKYDTYMEQGDIIRLSKIEKISPVKV